MWERGGVLKKGLIKTIVTAVIALILVSGSSSNVKVIKEVSLNITSCMKDDFTITDIETMGKNIISDVTNIPGSVATLHEKIIAESKYIFPVDEYFEGDSTTVHAAAGGVVSEIGNNSDIGKYIVIRHGNEAETIYGNLKEVNCTLNKNVKQGETIGLYERNPEKNFIYSLNYFD